MRVVVPTWTVDEHKGGTRTYLTQMVDALARRPEVDLTLLCSPGNRGLFPSGGQIRVVERAPAGGSGLRPVAEQWTGARLRPDLGDVLLTPSNIGLLGARIPQVVVVQAALALASVRAAHRDVPVSAAHRAYHRVMLGPSLRRADAVVTVTEWMRAELLRSVRRLDPSRVHVVPEGVAPPEARAVADAPARVVLFVSTLFPYKGADLLVDALAHLRAHRPDLDWTCRIVGRDPAGGATHARLRTRLDELGIGDRVTLVGPVAPERIREEYAAAGVFVYPSQVESFGLPPLEAMAAGVPVVASDAPGISEVVGEAARVVDARDAPRLAGAIAEVLTSAPLRRDLEQAGARRARMLSWDHAAAGLVEVLRGVTGP
jgi:glycosyltransferase involved in cell wall biosynthesis